MFNQELILKWIDWRNNWFHIQSQIVRISVSLDKIFCSRYKYNMQNSLTIFYDNLRDLSNNSLTGSVPDFLSQMSSLKFL